MTITKVKARNCPECGEEMLFMPPFANHADELEYHYCMDCHVRILIRCNYASMVKLTVNGKVETSILCAKAGKECDLTSDKEGNVKCPLITAWQKEIGF